MTLEVKFNGLALKNPLICGSASYSTSAAGLSKHIPNGYGALVTKTVTMKPLQGAPSPRVFWYDREEKTMLSGAEALRNPGIDKIAEAIERVREQAKQEDCKIIGSCSGNTIEEFLHMCKRFQEAGASAMELNMVCPSTGPHLGEDYAQLGKWWSQDTKRSVELINAAKEALDIPVWAKIPRDRLVDRNHMAILDSEARPDAYSFVGGRTPNLKIDIEKGKPVLPGNLLLMMEKKMPISPMVTGPVKPSTILHTAYFSKLTSTPLVCAGGLSKSSDILEAIMAGASAVQICTAVYRDFNVAPGIIKEIEEIMEKYGYGSVDEIRGVALHYLPDPPLFTVPDAKWSD